MYKELNISETEGVWAAYLALCDLKEETERLQAACAAKEAELYELRSRTAELFGERLSAEGADDDAVQAAKAMWLSEPAAAAHAALGCDIVEAANPYGCNQYGHGFKEPHGAAGGRGQKTFDFFDDVQDQKVVREQREIKKRFEDASDEVKKAYEDSREKAKELNRFHEETERRNNGRAWTEEEREHEKKLEDELMKADERSKTARRKQLEAARKAGKKVVPDFSDDDLGFIDDKLYDEFKDVFDDDDVKSSRTLEELLDDEEVAAANPYGCNQYGHEWRGKHGANFGGKSGGNQDSKKEPEKKPDTTDKPRGNAKPYSKPDSYSPEEFEKATPEKRSEIMQHWKNSIRKAQQALALYKSQNYKKEGSPEYESEKKRLQAEVEKEIEKFKDKVKKVGRLRGWDDKRSESTARTLLIPVIS